jgi:ABC-type branched-subunit amino acid transport system permease subunit
MEPLGNWIIGNFGGTQIHLTIFGGILLIVMLFMPQGIIPTLSEAIKQRQNARLTKVPSS